MQMQGLIFTIAILNNIVWDGVKKFGLWLGQCWKVKAVRDLSTQPFPYAFVFYLLFVIVCFTHIATLYELRGIDPSIILFHY
jgi:hypothetical protein